MNAVVIIIMAVLALFLLVAMFIELFGELFKSMRVAEQETWERDRFWKHGYAKRRRQLWIQLAAMSVVVVLGVVFGIMAFAAIPNLPNEYFTTGRDRVAEHGFGGAGLFLVALAGIFRIGIVRVKLKAIRQLRQKASAS